MLAALEGERERLAALRELPGQLRALFVQDAFEDDRGRLDLQTHVITIDRDRVNRDGRALIEAVKFTGVSARVRFRHGHDHTKLLPARFKRSLPRTFKAFRRCLTKDLTREAEQKQQHQQAIFHIFLFRFMRNKLSPCSTISFIIPIRSVRVIYLAAPSRSRAGRMISLSPVLLAYLGQPVCGRPGATRSAFL